MTQQDKISALKKYYTELPDNLTVGGGLDLSNTAITCLPDNLTVGGWLDLRNTAITCLPDNLTVGNSLDLRGTQITSDSNYIISDLIGSRNDRTTYFVKKDIVKCGCFSGSLQEFENKVAETYYVGSKYRKQYDDFINIIKGEIA